MIKHALLVSFLFVSFSLKGNVNIKMPTMGGPLFWTDVKVVNGWRIQENVVTGHFRLLNPNLVRYTWGDRKGCLAEMRVHTLLSPKKKVVFLIHGLGVKKRSLKCMAPQFEEQGFQTVNFGYSAFFEDLEQSMEKLHRVMGDYKGDVYVVTHSMGGILMRMYQEKYNRKISGLVMIAPPNQGALIVDSLKKSGFSGILGPNGKRLHSGEGGLPKTLPLPLAPFITIAGTQKSPVGYAPLLSFTGRDNDGCIAEKDTQLKGERRHYSFAASHNRIMHDKRVQAVALSFLLSLEALKAHP